MFSLLYGMYEGWRHKPTFNVLIIGLDNAGKTTLLERIKRLLNEKKELDETISTTPTIGLNVSKCEFKGVQCKFWDLGGAANLQRLWERYYPESHAVLFVVDSTDESRISEVKSALGNLVGNEECEGLPIGILANKQDCHEAAMEVVSIKETFNPLMSEMGARESKVFGVSASTGNGVIEALEWLLQVMAKNTIHRPAN